MPNSGYEQIAAEYYDPGHITSRNFDSATRSALKDKPISLSEGLVLEIGAGRGRAGEFLSVNPARVMQLDNSAAMLDLKPREASVLRILADACSIPLVSNQFSAVVGFLVDPFMGLNSLAEAYRMLVHEGKLLLTVPTERWGSTLRRGLGIDLRTTRFKVLGTTKTVFLPSLLYSKDQLNRMLKSTGFRSISIDDQCLPEGEHPISPDITSVCNALNVKHSELPLIHTIRASR